MLLYEIKKVVYNDLSMNIFAIKEFMGYGVSWAID